MFSPLRNGAGKRLREPFGKAGLTVAVIALVFAMLGGAYAATSSSEGGKATASAKAKKGPRGPKGATGPAGPQGLAGPAGAKGDKGDTGSAGAAGQAGTGVSSEEFGIGGKEGKCVGTGGSKFVAGATKTYACNGKQGEDGEDGEDGADGSPWTVGGTLPSGATETGAWAVSYQPGSEGYEALSFAVPLAQPLDESHVLALPRLYNGEDGIGPEHENCPGKALNPRAAKGFLCVYDGVAVSNPSNHPIGISMITNPGAKTFGSGGTAVSGASLMFPNHFVEGEEEVALGGILSGTWALTAP